MKMIKVNVTREVDGDVSIETIECDSYDIVGGALVFKNRLEPVPFLCINYWIKVEVVEGRVNEENK